MVAAVVLIINVVLTIWAVSRSGVQNGLGTLQDGSCKRTTTLTFWIHLGINILSTLLLGASNYSMQCLSSPTRSEIDKAHGQGVWLDIGVPSVRNLRRLSTHRVILWWLLAISSVPLHLLYNSAVFSSLCTRRYNIFLVSSEFLDGAPFNASSLFFVTPPGSPSSPLSEVQDYNLDEFNASDGLQDYRKNKTSMVRLENKACVEIYTAPIISSNSDLILISNYSQPNSSLLWYDLYQDSQLIIDSNLYSKSNSETNCSLPIIRHCDPSGVINNPQDWLIGDTEYEFLVDSPYNETRIQYCLSKRVEEHCKLQFSLVVMIVVIICNLMKTICMSTIAWKQDPEPLVTLGDAIASFLDLPDVTTEGNCIAEKTWFKQGRTWGLHLSRWDPKRLRWFRAASQRRWIICNIL